MSAETTKSGNGGDTGPCELPLDETTECCLRTAGGLALFQGIDCVWVCHLLIALLGDESCRLAASIRRLFGGLEPATVSQSLLQLAENEQADAMSEQSEACGALEKTSATSAMDHSGSGECDNGDRPLSTVSLRVVASARTLAEEWRAKGVGVNALAAAVLLADDPLTLEAFADAGVHRDDVRALGERLASSGRRPEGGEAADSVERPQVFSEERLEPGAFGPTAWMALEGMARARSSSSATSISDVNLIAALLVQDASRLRSALRVAGVSLSLAKRVLGVDGHQSSGSEGETRLRKDDLSRMAGRVLRDAAELAARDGVSVVGESQVVRAHIGRVARVKLNVYARMDVDCSWLGRYLEGFPLDREEGSVPEAAEEIGDIGTFLRSRVKGQDSVIKRVVPALRRLRSGLSEPGRPVAQFLFLGPTGVGKTELARQMAAAAFGEDEKDRDAHTIYIDCERLEHRRDITQLLGASQGFVGYKEGRLTNGLRDKPESVILLDEVDKAAREIWQSLLSLFDTGQVYEADGTVHDATRCIVVGTSNLGYEEAIREHEPWKAQTEVEREAVWARIQKDVEGCIDTCFSPEFIGRFGRKNFIVFQPPTRSMFREIIVIRVERLIEEMGGRGFRVDVPESVIDLLADFAWEHPDEGARSIGRLITEHLRDRIVDARLSDSARTEFEFEALAGSRRVMLRD